MTRGGLREWSYVVAVVTLAAVAGRDLRNRGVPPLLGAVVALSVLLVPVMGVPMWLGVKAPLRLPRLRSPRHTTLAPRDR